MVTQKSKDNGNDDTDQSTYKTAMKDMSSDDSFDIASTATQDNEKRRAMVGVGV